MFLECVQTLQKIMKLGDMGLRCLQLSSVFSPMLMKFNPDSAKYRRKMLEVSFGSIRQILKNV